MADSKKNIIGTGWSFPPSFNLHSRKVETVSGERDIIQSLNILFSTRPGERILVQGFGCDIEAAMFQNMDVTEKAVLENNIKRAIINYESRIELIKVEVDTSQVLDGIVFIQIEFSIATDNSRHNIVYPFFIREGTLIPKAF